jgi:hypothetical protein
VAHVQIVTPAGSVPTLGGVEQAIRDSDQEEDLRVIRRIVRAAREACHLTADG